MIVFKNVSEWRQYRANSKESLGFIPTMGALHKGHLSLTTSSKKENSKTLVSIFLNPTQFNNSDDLNNYPSSIEKDIAILSDAGIDYVFLPQKEEIYMDNYNYRVTENKISMALCGKNRPGHFDGVLSVVLKLLNIAGADTAYFGEKDFQQYKLVKGMSAAFFLQTKIKVCPTIRESDGLALSSRNRRLSPEQRALAGQFYNSLKSTKTTSEVKSQLHSLGFEVDYLEEIHQRRYGAVKLGPVRLIDNVKI